MSDQPFGDLLRRFRERVGLKRKELAERLGKSENTIGSWERSDLPPPLTTVKEIARVLNLDEEDSRQLLGAYLVGVDYPDSQEEQHREPYPLGNVLIELRNQHGLSQQTLAYRLGMSKERLACFERGEYLPGSIEILKNISRILRLSVENESLLFQSYYDCIHNEIQQLGIDISESPPSSVRPPLAKVIDYYTCFISYSARDHTFAEKLYNDLQKENVPCWFAPHDMRIGDKIRHRIDESIQTYEKLLLILSKHSVASQWVEHEVETAIGRELDGNPNVLFPIRLDDAIKGSKTGWASHIRRTRHIGDFTRWKEHDEYQKALESLLRDLNQKSL